MSRGTTGIYTAPAGTAAIAGQIINPTSFNSLVTDIGGEITNSLDRLGRSGMGAALAMSGFKITGLGPGTATGDGATFGQYTADIAAATTAIPNANLASMAAYTVKANATGSPAAVADVTLAALAALLVAQGFSVVPVGSITPIVGVAAPAGWLLCDGTAVSRTTYSSLFTTCATNFGVGDGSTTFNVPDLRGYFVRGFDAGRGIDPARVLYAAQADALASHTHVVNIINILAGAGAVQNAVNAAATGGAATQATGVAETRPKNIAFNYCIKF